MSNEKVVLTALQVQNELFETLEGVLNTEKRKKIFIAITPGDSQTEVAEKVGVNQSSVSKAISKLSEFGLVEEHPEGGYRKTLKSMDHPLLEHLWQQEVLEDDK